MYILAFESSCDDTSVALLYNDQLIAMQTHTQVEHERTQWVVPELAARLHADHVFTLLNDVLEEGGITLDKVDIFAATKEPGLIPSLLIGKTVAKTLAHIFKKPLIWVNHIEGHIFSVLLERTPWDIIFPSIVLSASGGHNDLYLWRSLSVIEKIGQTRDDSAGESLDKVWRAMGLWFPAGPQMDQLAQQFRGVSDIKFPLVLPTDSWDFSFSGIKSAAIREIEAIIQKRHLTVQDQQKIAFSYQSTVTNILSTRLIQATKHFHGKSVCLVGGVSANSDLRKKVKQFCDEENIPFLLPSSLRYCGDNAAMIGIRAYYTLQS